MKVETPEGKPIHLIEEDVDKEAPELLKSDKGVIQACEHNAYLLMAREPAYELLHFDDFLHRMRIGKEDWNDSDDLKALLWLQGKYKIARFNLGHARNAAKSIAYSRRRDSLREFVETLPEWDQTPRIETAFIVAWGAPDTPLIRAASGNFFVALIARALQPGAQVDTLFTFEGPQGTLKSKSMRELGGDFYAETTANIGTVDFQRELRELWIAELSELDSLRGRESSTIKRVLSSPKDRFVEKYATHAQSYARRAVAVATTNEATYWEDSTGARRLVPITCGEIHIDLIGANRLQWFAEARYQHSQGATWWIFPAAILDAQEDRQQVDPWEDVLSDRIAHGRKTDSMGREAWPTDWISTADIMRDWLELQPHQQGKVSGSRLAKVMRRLGFRPKRSTSGDERGWVSEVSGQVSATFPL